MALIPEGAELIRNPVTAAPGFRIKNVFVMAGVPKIMKAMVEDILDSFEPGIPFLSRNIPCAYPESVVADALADLQTQHMDVDIGSYPKISEEGGFMVNIVVRGQEEKALEIAEKAILEALDLIKAE
jgi:molybdopterin-biosynthesis enzyme MoeA-like protein